MLKRSVRESGCDPEQQLGPLAMSASERDNETDATRDRSDDANTVDRSRPESWPKEIGGQRGPEPTRYGDWEHNGRCSDF